MIFFFRFIFKSNYDDHINRKVMLITFSCQKCKNVLIFKNRCRFLEHIKSHSSKAITFNYQDLNVDILPLEDFEGIINSDAPATVDINSKPNQTKVQGRSTNRGSSNFTCEVCNATVENNLDSPISDIRAAHFMRRSNKLFKCPICVFILPNQCAMETHIKLHLQMKPFICPECGKTLNNYRSALQYPFEHDCHGFKVMKMSARIMCQVKSCKPFHPASFVEHMKENHLVVYFKCVNCTTASINKDDIIKHMEQNYGYTKDPTVLYQCQICKCHLIFQNYLNNHLDKHATNIFVYPCWSCDTVFKKILDLINHSKVCQVTRKSNEDAIENTTEKYLAKTYKVHKKCEKCSRIFVYKCKYNIIDKLPNECPYCSPTNVVTPTIKCPICKISVNFERKDINKHFALFHETINIDPRICLERYNYHFHKNIIKQKSKIRRNKRKVKSMKKCTEETTFITTDKPNQSTFIKCIHCGLTCSSKEKLEQHLKSEHNDPCAAYQCLECGQSFVVKRSFSTHLMVEHNISDSENYIRQKKCYNENALINKQATSNCSPELTSNIILKENQCKICLEQFDNKIDMEKHFRVHGMAFLLKTTKRNMDLISE